MSDIPGMIRPEIQELPQVASRMTFIYLERCQISREDSAVLVRDDNGTVRIPAAAITAILLGPGTSITHRAVELIGDAGVGLVWVGEFGVRFYASGRPLTHRSHLLLKQAELVSNQRKHLQVVRKMYQIRFPGENISELTTQQLRGREGSRMRRAYREASKKWNVSWHGRDYIVDDYSAGDPVNQALSAGNACLYGIAHAVISALGCSPGLGFVHVGHDCSFVYDIADLYKADITIPIAFEAASEKRDDIGRFVRRRVRDSVCRMHLLEKMVRDITYLLSDKTEFEENNDYDVVFLWDSVTGLVENGKQYSQEES